MASNKLHTLYDYLQVTPNADADVIHAAYKALIKKRHTDLQNQQNYVGDDLLYKLNLAKETLLDQSKRSRYDQEISDFTNKLIGNYKILEEINEGAFSRTYKAEHVLLNEYACLKQNLYMSPEDNEFLLKEARLLWNINHHSLPTLKDIVKTDEGSYVLAMTYVDGKNLDTIIKEHGPIHPEHVCWIAQRTLNALNYLHFNGIIHSDVKPANLIIKPKEHNAILVDYGFSVQSPTRKTKANGYTPAFAPPELILGNSPLPESDLYSLGATMIYALGGNPVAKTYGKDVPDPLKNFFDKLVLHDPRSRPNWQSCDLVKELSDIRQKVFGRKQSDLELKI